VHPAGQHELRLHHGEISSGELTSTGDKGYTRELRLCTCNVEQQPRRAGASGG
jgi:hypothetical protein